jgi:hypothetical protein
VNGGGPLVTMAVAEQVIAELELVVGERAVLHDEPDDAPAAVAQAGYSGSASCLSGPPKKQ